MTANTRLDILFPVGRIVQGDLYTPNTTDADNKPLVIKTGPNAGQPRQDFYFAVAFAKAPGETHWGTTEWGAKIWAHAHALWPGGQTQRGDFAWKITDGDSTIPNKAGKKPVDQVGHAGHWIVRFSSSYAPKIVNKDGSAYILDKDAVKAGDYVQVFGNVDSNTSTQTPGLYVNHALVSLQGFGERISNGPDAASVGFGGAALPAGASAVPLGAMTPPAVGTPPAVPGVPSGPTASPPVPGAVAAPPPMTPTPTPNTAFVSGAVAPPPPGAAAAPPPPPAAPVRTMLPAANGVSYEAMIAAGWNDANLVQHGMMAA